MEKIDLNLFIVLFEDFWFGRIWKFNPILINNLSALLCECLNIGLCSLTGITEIMVD